MLDPKKKNFQLQPFFWPLSSNFEVGTGETTRNRFGYGGRKHQNGENFKRLQVEKRARRRRPGGTFEQHEIWGKNVHGH